MKILGARPVTLMRETTAGGTNSEGQYTPGTITEWEIEMSIQPFERTSSTAFTLEEGERYRDYRVGLTHEPLIAVSVLNESMGDRIKITEVHPIKDATGATISNVATVKIYQVRSVLFLPDILEHYECLLLLESEDMTKY